MIGVLAVGYPEEIPAAKPRTSISEKIKDFLIILKKVNENFVPEQGTS